MPDIQFRTNESQDLSSNWSTSRTVSGAGNAGLSIEDFYKLLAAQLRYQDADNPMDTSEMMAQMVQTQMIDTINQMNQISVITYASSMIGKEVTVMVLDERGWPTGEEATGVVTGASISGSMPTLFVDGKRYLLSQVVMLGSKPTVEDPKDPEDPKNPGDGSDVPGSEGSNGDDDGTPPVDGAGDGNETPPVDGAGDGNETPPVNGGGDGDTDPSTGNEGNNEP